MPASQVEERAVGQVDRAIYKVGRVGLRVDPVWVVPAVSSY